MIKNNLIDKRYGKLLVIASADSDKRKDGHGTFSKWKCRCDCGTEILARGNNLDSGIVNSCGCLKIEKAKNQVKKQPEAKVGLMRVYRAYITGANKRGYKFELNVDQFRELTSKNCHYCDSEPKTIAGGWNEHSKYIYNGIDRIDNDEGYTIENCITSCVICNYAKRKMSYTDFTAWLDRLVKFRK